MSIVILFITSMMCITITIIINSITITITITIIVFIIIFIIDSSMISISINLPPLIIYPLITKTTWGGKMFVTINLDGGTITPLINDDFWFDLHPS